MIAFEINICTPARLAEMQAVFLSVALFAAVAFRKMCKIILKLDQFKLFVFDIALLKHMAGIDNSAILLKSDYQYKGPLTENCVLKQLRGQFAVEPGKEQNKT